MARKHGFFRPHVAGLSGIYSTTLREGGWVPPAGYAFLLYKDGGGTYRTLLYKDANGNYQPLAYKVA